MYIAECDKVVQSLYDAISSGGTVPEENGTPPEDPIAFLQTVSIPQYISAFYKAINLSLLAGEYLPDLEKTEKQINGTIGVISGVFSLGFNLPADGKQIDISTVINCFKTSLEEYLNFIRELKQFLPHKRPSSIRNIVVQEPYRLPFEDNGDLQSRSNLFGDDNLGGSFNLFRMNLSVAKYDHTLIASEDVAGNLLAIMTNLDNPRLKSLDCYSIILDKCKFLIKKVLYSIDDSHSLRFQNQDFHYNSDQFSTRYFSSLEKQLEYHSGATPFSVVGEATDLSTKLSDYYTLVQVYKDDDKNRKQIEDLIKDFRERCYTEQRLGSADTFNKRALHLAYNYLINNELSLEVVQANKISQLGSKKSDERFTQRLQEISSSLEEIEAIQNKTGVVNYFPFLKMSKLISEHVARLIQREDVDYGEIIEPLVSDLETYLDKTIAKCKQCREQNFIAYQLSYKECIVDLSLHADSPLQSVLLASSYILPLDYTPIEQKVEALRRDLYKYQTIVGVQQSINHEKKAIQNIKKEFNELNKKSIEIISIFAAIVVFSAGSIKIFEIEGITFQDGLKFMLCFSYCLILFVFLIWLVTRENIRAVSILHWTFFSMLSVISIISLLYVVGWVNSVFSGFIVAALLITGLMLLKTIILTKIKY